MKLRRTGFLIWALFAVLSVTALGMRSAAGQDRAIPREGGVAGPRLEAFSAAELTAAPAEGREGLQAGQDEAPAPAATGQEGPDAVARQVYAIFQENCLECHNGAEDAGGLDLRTDEGLRAGGANGKVVVAHDPEASTLFRSVSWAARPYMPFGRRKLADEQIALIRRWIENGGSLAGVPAASPEAVADAEDARPEDGDRGRGRRDDAPNHSPEELARLALLEARPITAEERAYWAFVRPARPPVPAAEDPAWNANPIDAFLLAAMQAQGLKPAPPADRRTLVRRAYLDVWGLPPTPEQVDAFLHDDSPDAWEKLVEALLASPHYGERWARHWMDLVRYADSGGYEFDTDRPEMYRYRDYLVDSFNDDKPYDQFVKEQLAGDELAPESPDPDVAMIATGYLRLGPEGGGNRLDQLDDLITTTSLTFMGVTVGCARCHNHKFDPIAQKDYYRMQAVFYPTTRVEHPLASEDVVAANGEERRRIRGLMGPLEDRKEEIEQPYHQQIVDREVAKLPEYMQIAWNTPPEERTEGQRLNVIQIEKTLELGSLRNLVREEHVVELMPDEVKAQHAEVKAQLEALEEQMPERLPTARAIGERDREPEPSYFLHRGSPDAKGTVMAPGVLSVATEGEWDFPEPPAGAESSWRRRGFADWLVHEDNPLTARVMVNRLWQHHFGEGIVATPSNLGRMGIPPTHPELLDWLAAELMESGWSMKHMHRLMLTSRAYRMSSDDDPANHAIDPENRHLWRMPRLRLEAEIIRDAILATAGTLDLTVGGPAVFPYIDPDLFEKSSRRDWPGLPDDDQSTWRRSLYVYSKRSIRYPMFETFDQPNLINSIDRRNRTTIAPQALILMNNQMVLFQAGKLAERLREEVGDDVGAQVDRAFLLALSRPPDEIERANAVELISEGDALEEFCHLLFNLNEFLYRQ